MKVLVTGGAGFIGSNFVRLLLDEHEGIEVVNYDLLTYAGSLDNLADREYETMIGFPGPGRPGSRSLRKAFGAGEDR